MTKLKVHFTSTPIRYSLLGLGTVAIAVAVVLLTTPSVRNFSPKKSSSTSISSGLQTQPKGTVQASGSTFPGKNGIKAQWIVQQNKLPGTTAWKISSGTNTTGISGFANMTYAAQNQSVTLYISSTSPTYKVYAYRMGYYGGKGGRLIWSSSVLKGITQKPCTVARPTNMVSCANWQPSLNLRISSQFVQGDYLLKLVGSTGSQSYIPLTIWDPASNATYIVKNDVFTWQAWNPYGGYDFYAGIGTCPKGHYPLCSRARVVSFDRPYAYGNGAADFLGNEYPLVYWAEKHGLNLTYWTDQTVIQHPNLLTRHTTILSLGHDECWSYRERKAVESANHNNGLNVVFFGASAMLRHVRLQSSPLGSLRQEVDYRNSYKDPLYGKGSPLEVTGNTWGSPPANWPENNFVGETYVGYLLNGTSPKNFVTVDSKAWIFKGTGLKNGQSIPGVIQSDFDSFISSFSHPSNLQILGHSPLPANDAQYSITSGSKYVYSDMTYYDNPISKGGVFDSGTNNWINSMSKCSTGSIACPSKLVRKITGNLLLAFGKGPAGISHPSVANWKNYQTSS